MNPQEQDHTPSFELPPARPVEQQAAVPQPEQQQDLTNETQATVALEHAAPTSAQPSQPQDQSVQQQAPPMPQPAPTSQQQATGAPSPTWMPQIADDTDLIEKEWVIKAKEIVAKTARDPHLQNREINKFKAEYMRKRYNKDLKLSEDS